MQIDMLVGSVANGLNSSGGFCAGSRIVVDHQRINSLFRVLRRGPCGPRILRLGGHQHPAEHAVDPQHAAGERARDPGRARPRRGHHDPLALGLADHPRPPTTLSPSAKPPNPATPAPRDAPSFDIAGEEHLLQDIVDEALAQGVWITRACRLRGQELVEARPSIRLAVTAALSRKECERAAGVIKAAVAKVLAKRK